MTETQKRLDDWYEKFMSVYPNLSQVEEGRKVLYRYAPSDEILNEIFGWVCDHNRYADVFNRQKRPNDPWSPKLPNLYSFFSKSRWKDPIPSTSALLVAAGESKPPQACTTPGCQDRGVAIADKKLVCSRCYTKLTHPHFASTMKETLKAMGFTRGKDEPWRTASMRCIRDNGLINQVPRPLLTEDDY